MQAPYVTRLIRNTGENFLNLSGSFLDVCGAGRSWRVLHNAPPPALRPSAPAARADGAAGARGRREAAGSRPRRLWGGGQLWDPINYVTLGCRFSMDAKRRRGGGGGALGSPGGSGGESVFSAVPNCWGPGPANLLTHMSLLPRASLGKGQERGPAHAAARPGSRPPHAGSSALCNSLSGEAKVSDGGRHPRLHNGQSPAPRLCGLHREIKLPAVIALWFGKGEGRRKRRVAGIWGEKKKKKRVFGFFRMM